MPSQSSDLRENLVKYAAFILNRRPYFRHTLHHKLVQRCLKLEINDFESVVNSLLDELSASGYLNDSYLAQAFVRRQLNKGYGPRLIRYKLQQLKLSSDAIAHALDSEADSEALQRAAQSFLKRKHYKDHRKASHSLYQRGFDNITIRRLFDSVDFTD